MAGKLGKKPFVPSHKDFKLAQVELALPQFPQKPFGYGTIYTDWGMLGNDNAGDCVEASAAHQTMLWNLLAGRHVGFTDQEVLDDYTAATGYNPDDPNTDQGTEIRAYLDYRRGTGILATDGKRHKIDAYVQINPKDWDELIRCIFTFGIVEMGFEFPDTAADQFDAGEDWDVVPGARIEGGHDVCCVGSPDTFNRVTCITWGKRQVMTRAFYQTYNDESWVPLTKESLLPASNVRHIDWDHLSQMLASL